MSALAAPQMLKKWANNFSILSKQKMAGQPGHFFYPCLGIKRKTPLFEIQRFQRSEHEYWGNRVEKRAHDSMWSSYRLGV